MVKVGWEKPWKDFFYFKYSLVDRGKPNTNTNEKCHMSKNFIEMGLCDYDKDHVHHTFNELEPGTDYTVLVEMCRDKYVDNVNMQTSISEKSVLKVSTRRALLFLNLIATFLIKSFDSV